MTPSPTSNSASPYHEFRQRGLGESEDHELAGRVFLDHDGTSLYEREMCPALLLKIIENHDDDFLRQYLEQSPNALGPTDTNSWDPFCVAAACGTANALNMILEHWAADPSRCWSAPDEREFDLLNAACHGGQVDNVRLLTDKNLPWAARFGNIHKKAEADCPRGTSALMAAAGSYPDIPYGNEATRRSEELVHYLLDMGASARDSNIRHDFAQASRGDPDSWSEQQDEPPAAVGNTLVANTVLTLAIKGASAELVRRLIEGGADVHARVLESDVFEGRLFGGDDMDSARDVTALHIGSFYFNAEGIQALFDNRGSKVSVEDMVSCRDDYGRTPLHWAAGSELPFSCKDPGDDDTSNIITSRAISTIKLLLAGNPETINARDDGGDTPLCYAIRTNVHRIRRQGASVALRSHQASLRQRRRHERAR